MGIDFDLRLKNTIVNALRKEDLELSQIHNKGIFFLPELAITYIVGKAIMLDAEKIFGVQVEEWKSDCKSNETKERTDLILKLANEKILFFELKKRCNAKDYADAINRLKKIPSDSFKFFCAVMDCDAGKEIKQTEEQEIKFGNEVKRIVDGNKFFDYFTTRDLKYNDKQICCVVGLWQVN